MAPKRSAPKSDSDFQGSSESSSEEIQDEVDSENDEPAENGKKRKGPSQPLPSGSNSSGYLTYLFTGDQNPAEIVVFRKICMKYGLQAWDEMAKYIPWRNRAAFRTTLCHIIRKQALSEYDGIRADPFRIQKDNPLDDSNNEDYIVKGGMRINQKWDRSASEWDDLRKENTKKYGISEEDADQIEIPIIMSVEYMRQMGNNRKQSLLLKRAALRYEAQRRGIAQYSDLGVADLVLQPSDALMFPPSGDILRLAPNQEEGFFELDD